MALCQLGCFFYLTFIAAVFRNLYLNGLGFFPLDECITWFSVWVNGAIVFLVIPIVCLLLARWLAGRILFYLVLANLLYIVIIHHTWMQPLTCITYRLQESQKQKGSTLDE